MIIFMEILLKVSGGDVMENESVGVCYTSWNSCSILQTEICDFPLPVSVINETAVGSSQEMIEWWKKHTQF